MQRVQLCDFVKEYISKVTCTAPHTVGQYTQTFIHKLLAVMPTLCWQDLKSTIIVFIVKCNRISTSKLNRKGSAR